MLSHGGRKALRTNSLLFYVIVICGLGLFSGILTFWISPILILGGLVAALLIIATIKRPEIGLLGLLVATSSIVFDEQLPVLSIGGISLHIPDLLLLGSLGLIAIRWMVNPEFKIIRTPLDWPLLIFYGTTLLSTSFALFQSSLEIEPARRAIRVLSYYLAFFVVTNLVRKRSQLNFLLKGFFFLATIVAAAMVVQYFLGTSILLLPGRVETLNTENLMYEGVTRIIPPGWSIVMVSVVAIFCITILEKSRRLAFPRILQFCFLAIAIVFTFMRAYWAALIFVLFLSVFIFKGYQRQRFFGWSLVVILLSGVILLYGFHEPKSQVGKLVEATYSRFETLLTPQTVNEASLQWRYVENEYALRSILSHPLLGLGFGALYRPYDRRIDYAGMGWDARGYIHNGHLWIFLDSGLFGYLAFTWLSLAFLRRGFRFWRSAESNWLKGVVLGFTLAYLAALIASLTTPTFTVQNWTPVIGIMMGINEVILMRFRQEEPGVEPIA